MGKLVSKVDREPNQWAEEVKKRIRDVEYLHNG
jgi:hypothetical protein